MFVESTANANKQIFQEEKETYINVVQIHEEQKYRKVVKKIQCSIHLDIYSIDGSQKTTNVYLRLYFSL